MIFIVADLSPSGAASYLERYGVETGWATNDQDNVAGSNAVLMSGLFSGTPWVGVVRASDMTLYARDSMWGGVDLVAVAQELAQ